MLILSCCYGTIFLLTFTIRSIRKYRLKYIKIALFISFGLRCNHYLLSLEARLLQLFLSLFLQLSEHDHNYNNCFVFTLLPDTIINMVMSEEATNYFYSKFFDTFDSCIVKGNVMVWTIRVLEVGNNGEIGWGLKWRWIKVL